MHAPASVPARTLIVLMACAVSALAQEPVLLDGKPVPMIANDKGRANRLRTTVG
jgi:hypothetical protein